MSVSLSFASILSTTCNELVDDALQVETGCFPWSFCRAALGGAADEDAEAAGVAAEREGGKTSPRQM